MARKRMTVGEARQRIRSFMPGREGEQIVRMIDGLIEDITTLKAWGDAIAAKLNADAGVGDTNYTGPDI